MRIDEITAMLRLLELLELKGCLDTIDATGCKKEITQRIIDSNVDYNARREGQPAQVCADVAAVFDEAFA